MIVRQTRAHQPKQLTCIKAAINKQKPETQDGRVQGTLWRVRCLNFCASQMGKLGDMFNHIKQTYTVLHALLHNMSPAFPDRRSCKIKSRASLAIQRGKHRKFTLSPKLPPNSPSRHDRLETPSPYKSSTVDDDVTYVSVSFSAPFFWRACSSTVRRKNLVLPHPPKFQFAFSFETKRIGCSA